MLKLHSKPYIIALLIAISFNTFSQKKMEAIKFFEKYIVGDFSNKKQVDEEVKAGKQIHPLAIHVNRKADDKILNAPKRNGFWILEESYYTNPNKPMEAKPYLFFFENDGENQVKLTVYRFPERIKKEEMKNENKSLKVDFNELTLSPTFKGATYIIDGETITTNAPNDLGNGMKFTLMEKFTKNQLEVMELLEKAGKSLTPYTTPLIYDRL
jgi:hypothetical protein